MLYCVFVLFCCCFLKFLKLGTGQCPFFLTFQLFTYLGNILVLWSFNCLMDFRKKHFQKCYACDVSSWEGQERQFWHFCFYSFDWFKLPILNGYLVMQLAYQETSQKLLRSLISLLPKKMGQQHPVLIVPSVGFFLTLNISTSSLS